jgi:GNAT superfamily N-acetyltransferase
VPAAPYRIDTMTRGDLDLVVSWAAEEGWNPGRHDADAFFTADPNGFLIGRLGDEPIASISVVRYGASFGFLGFYIVRPEHRGQGYGLAIWNAGMAYLEGRTVGLDGVVAQQGNYRKSGFELAHVNLRHQGTAPGQPVDDPAIVALASVRSAAINAYDRPFFADDRTEFLRAWLALPGAIGLGIAHHGNLGGYGVARPSQTGYRIGPLFADTPEFAERLFSTLVGQIPAGEPYFLDIPATNPNAPALVARHGLTPMFETARMYKGKAPELPMDRWYGVTSLELG